MRPSRPITGESPTDRGAVIYLVRHADASTRTGRPDDHLRPLSGLGRLQAAVMAERLAGVTLGEIVCSPLVRCVESIEPLAMRSGRPITIECALKEGGPIDPMLALMERVPPGSVLCTHGDMLTAFVEHLDSAGAGPDAQPRLDKGVIWVVLREPDRFSIVEVIPPPAPGYLLDDAGSSACPTAP